MPVICLHTGVESPPSRPLPGIVVHGVMLIFVRQRTGRQRSKVNDKVNDKVNNKAIPRCMGPAG